MTLKKYGDNEQAEIFVGREAEVVNRHLQRVAKPVSEFSDEEKQELQADLEKVRADSAPQDSEQEPAPQQKKEPTTTSEGKRSNPPAEVTDED